MIYILAGLLLWILSHGLKRFLPDLRQAMGRNGAGIVALGSFIGIALMVYGYWQSDLTVLWVAPDWAYPLNNVLMLIAIYLFAVGSAKTRLALSMRHPMLNGMMVWGVAHVLVDGTAEGALIFGGLAAWAHVTKSLIDRSDAWVIPNPSPMGKEFSVVAIALIVYIGIIHLHGYLGAWPLWPGWPIGGVAGLILTPFS